MASAPLLVAALCAVLFLVIVQLAAGANDSAAVHDKAGFTYRDLGDSCYGIWTSCDVGSCTGGKCCNGAICSKTPPPSDSHTCNPPPCFSVDPNNPMSCMLSQATYCAIASGQPSPFIPPPWHQSPDIWPRPTTRENADADTLIDGRCPNDLMNASSRSWNFHCGCQGGSADAIKCDAGTSEYNDGSTVNTDWCMTRGVDFDNSVCLRHGRACYKHNGDYDNSDANKLKCCAPFDDNLSASAGSPAAQTCPPGWCKGSQHCTAYLTNLCNTEDGLNSNTEICKKFAFDNRSSVKLPAVAGWCAKQIGHDSSGAATISTKAGPDGELVPGGFCSCYNSKFAPDYKYSGDKTVPDPVASHPFCFNKVCANYGYAMPEVVNASCPSVCLMVLDAVAQGNISIDHNEFKMNCPDQAGKLDAAGKQAADEAAMLKKLHDAEAALDAKLAAAAARAAADAKAAEDARAALAAAAAAPASASPSSTPTVIAVVVVLCAIGYMLSMRAGAHRLSAAASAAASAASSAAAAVRGGDTIGKTAGFATLQAIC